MATPTSRLSLLMFLSEAYVLKEDAVDAVFRGPYLGVMYMLREIFVLYTLLGPFCSTSPRAPLAIPNY